MKRLVLYRGHPGSGKTTLAEETLEIYKAVGFTTSHWDDHVLQNHTRCQWGVENDMDNGVDLIIVSNTFTKLWEMKPYLNLADKNKYYIFIYRCQGDFKNVHNVPIEVVERMKREYEPHPYDILLGVSDNG